MRRRLQEDGLDLEMGRRLGVIGCVVRSVCLIIGRIALSFVLRVLDTLESYPGSFAWQANGQRAMPRVIEFILDIASSFD